MSKPDGGPAFPSAWHPTADGYQRGDCGLSLRDYFAAKALAGITDGEMWPADADAPEIARRSYVMADAMIAERSKP